MWAVAQNVDGEWGLTSVVNPKVLFSDVLLFMSAAFVLKEVKSCKSCFFKADR